MTTYKIYKDYIEMADIATRRHFFFHSDEDLRFILSCLRSDFLLQYCNEEYQYRARYLKVYNMLVSIIDLLDTTELPCQSIVPLVRNTLEFMSVRNYKHFKFILMKV